MENRSVVKVLILSIVTLGIYGIVWHFWTTKELKAKGADIPTAWLQIVPLANIYFYFKYYEGAEKVTGGGVSGILYFVLALFVSPIVSALLAQNEYNKMGGAQPVNDGGHPAQQPQAPEQVAAAHSDAASAPAAPASAPQPAHPAPQADAAPSPAPAPAPAATPQPQAPAPAAPQQDVAPADPNQQQPPQQPPQNPPLVQ